jgi:predicted CXXCH cytochrome family protein
LQPCGPAGYVLDIELGAGSPPHDVSNSINCINCHTPHGAAGGSITREAGNPNLCMTCHTPGGLANNRPFNDADQAVAGVSGFSHRWDSGPSGHVSRQPGNTSSGSLRSGGVFSGRIENRYLITITASGDVGSASYDWSDGGGNSGVGVAGNDVPLADGLLLDFADGGSSPSFIAGDSWMVDVRTDLRLPDFGDPFERPMAQRLAGLVGLGGGVFDTTYAKVVCSVCHDQHSQENQPFDPTAPPFLGDGSGEGRFFQRRDNNFNQMCVVCHSARNVASSDLGSHPVGVPIPGGDFQPPAALELDANGEVACMTCHSPHYADSGGANGGAGDGYLLNQGIGDICLSCHTLLPELPYARRYG